jgi:hypothetical protein
MYINAEVRVGAAQRKWPRTMNRCFSRSSVPARPPAEQALRWLHPKKKSDAFNEHRVSLKGIHSPVGAANFNFLVWPLSLAI